MLMLIWSCLNDRIGTIHASGVYQSKFTTALTNNCSSSRNNDLITEPSSFSVTLFPVFLRLLITMGLEFYSRSAVVVVIVVQSLNLAFFLCPPWQLDGHRRGRSGWETEDHDIDDERVSPLSQGDGGLRHRWWTGVSVQPGRRRFAT